MGNEHDVFDESNTTGARNDEGELEHEPAMVTAEVRIARMPVAETMEKEQALQRAKTQPLDLFKSKKCLSIFFHRLFGGIGHHCGGGRRRRRRNDKKPENP